MFPMRHPRLGWLGGEGFECCANGNLTPEYARYAFPVRLRILVINALIKRSAEPSNHFFRHLPWLPRGGWLWSNVIARPRHAANNAASVQLAVCWIVFASAARTVRNHLRYSFSVN
jgi:hypothetical protein